MATDYDKLKAKHPELLASAEVELALIEQLTRERDELRRWLEAADKWSEEKSRMLAECIKERDALKARLSRGQP